MATNPDWFYAHSDEIEQDIAIHKETLWVFCKDGTKYSPTECEILRKKGGIDKRVHIIKHLFNGKIVQ